MAKKAVIILADGFEEIEAVTCIDILRRAGIYLITAGLSGLAVMGSHGVEIKADVKLADAGEDFDACILPGGMPGAKNLAASAPVKTLLININKKGGIIAAICASPAVVLAPLGLLKGRAAACYPGMECESGIKWQEKGVVADGNIITSRGPATALDFSITIVEKLLGREAVDKLKMAVLAA